MAFCLQRLYRKLQTILSLSCPVKHSIFYFFPMFLIPLMGSFLTWQFRCLITAEHIFYCVTEVVIYLFMSLITRYEIFNNWHFTQFILNHFVSSLSFIGLHTIIGLVLCVLEGGNLYCHDKFHILHWWKFYHICSLKSFQKTW